MPVNPPFGFVICEIYRVVVWDSQKLVTRYVGTVAFWRGYSADKSQSPRVPGLGMSTGSHKVICSWYLLVLVLEALGGSYAVN